MIASACFLGERLAGSEIGEATSTSCIGTGGAAGRWLRRPASLHGSASQAAPPPATKATIRKSDAEHSGRNPCRGATETQKRTVIQRVCGNTSNPARAMATP